MIYDINFLKYIDALFNAHVNLIIYRHANIYIYIYIHVYIYIYTHIYIYKIQLLNLGFALLTGNFQTLNLGPPQYLLTCQKCHDMIIIDSRHIKAYLQRSSAKTELYSFKTYNFLMYLLMLSTRDMAVMVFSLIKLAVLETSTLGINVMGLFVV